MKKWLVSFAVFVFLGALSAGGAEANNSYSFALAWGSFGSGAGQFTWPHSIAADPSGNVYVVDNAGRIQKFDPNGAFLTGWSDQGAYGVAVDSSGNVYVTNTQAPTRIDKFDSSGHPLAQYSAQFNMPEGIAVDPSGNIYVADSYNNRIVKFDPNGNLLLMWGSNGSGPGQFYYPFDVAADSNGNVYVDDSYNNRIQKFDTNGNFLSMWGSYGSGPGQFQEPNGLALDSYGNVYVADTHSNRMQKFDTDGNFLSQWGSYGTGAGQFNFPFGVAADSSGTYVYVADFDNNRIEKFQAYGTITATVLYNGQPLQNAYIYLQPGGRLSPRQKYFLNSSLVYGPSDANGVISASVPAGAHHVRITKRANYPSAFGPPMAGDYVWFHTGNPPAVTVSSNQTTDLGTVNTTIYGRTVTVSGTVKGASGKALAGWAVKATTVPCYSGNWAYAHSFNECGSVKYPAFTDANGNYAITLENTGTYYLYASPALNFANTNYPGGYPTCATSAGCENCGDYFYYNCPVNVTGSLTGQDIVVPGY